MGRSPDDVLALLRRQTRAHHEALENGLRLTREDLSLTQYINLLERFYGLYLPLEQALGALREAYLYIGLDWPHRVKVPLLVKDLTALGRPADLRTLALCGEIPRLDSLYQALGCLYVLEGATLGGQILSKHLRRLLGLTAETGAAFFTSYGAQVGARWKAFQAMLRAQITQADAQEETVKSACATFIAFQVWLLRGDVSMIQPCR